MDKKALLRAKKAELAELKAKLAAMGKACDRCKAPGASHPVGWVAGSGKRIEETLCDKCHDQWVQDRATF